jgi:hypothetical protein
LLKMFALMNPVFLINISLLDYFSNNSWNHFWQSQSMSKHFPSFLDQLKISLFIYSHMNSQWNILNLKTIQFSLLENLEKL